MIILGSLLRFNFSVVYEEPLGSNLNFEFKPEGYVSPNGGKLAFNFLIPQTTDHHGGRLSFNFPEDDIEPPETINQYMFPAGFDDTSVGQSTIFLGQRWINTVGIYDSALSNPSVRNDTQFLKPVGFNALGFSHQTIHNKNVTITVAGIDLSRVATPSIINYFKNINGRGFNSELLGKPTAYNLLKFISLNNRGISSQAFGQPYLEGGVKYIRPNSLSTLAIGQHKLVNTRADQTARLTGIVAPSIPRPNVSPQSLNARGFLGTLWGSPYVQRNPSPNGWVSERFGTSWISRSPRFYTVTVGEVTQYGSPKIFDAKQIVTINGVIPGGIFGDIQIRNLNFKIAPGSISAPPISDWTIVENTTRYYEIKGFYSFASGLLEIQNATPSFSPLGFDASIFGRTLVAERIRRLNLSGFNLLGIGRPSLTKTPQLSPGSIAAPSIPQPTLTLYTRYVFNAGRSMSLIGTPFIAMSKRKLQAAGISGLYMGVATLTHGNRELLVKGAEHSRYGTAQRVWFRVRTLEPVSIFQDHKATGHIIGGTQHITTPGFDASRYGTRIIPESQYVLANNFASLLFGTPKLNKTREYLSVNGFNTAGKQPADRWGNTRVYNSRQYIIQTFDIDSELNPPKIQGWMTVVNRNRFLGITGTNTALFGRAFVRNNATLMIPPGINTQPLGKAFISHRVRPVKVEGIEHPYMSGWSNVHNAAFVIAPKAWDSAAFSSYKIANTRRYYQKVGNFETLIFGDTLISFKIRDLKVEARHSIGPIYIPIHKVELYSRYVETEGNEFSGIGLPALTIHKKIITPRWYLRDLFGDVGLFNVTPELKTRGRNAEEFGQNSIRTQWRDVQVFGDNANLYGKPSIAFRDRSVHVKGMNVGAIGRLQTKGTASPPLSTQYIYLNNVENRGEDQDDDTNIIRDGYGIGIIQNQVPAPFLRSNVIRPAEFVATLMGTPICYNNGILMENGIKLDKECGTPKLQLSKRTLEVESINNRIEMGKPSLSPHTIYAVLEAPNQAKENHKSSGLHAVNSNSGHRKAGEVFGNARVWMHNPYLNVRSVTPRNDYGTPRVQLKRRYVELKGIQAYRFGWHKIGDGTQEIIHRQGNGFSLFGQQRIALVKDSQLQVKNTGINSLNTGRPLVEYFHRTIKPIGLNALVMGSSRGGTLYMPQSLHIGPRRPTIPVGSLMEKWGTTYIGLKVREILVQGFDSFVMEYDALNFDKRMRVQRGDGGPQPNPSQIIVPVAFDASRLSASNVKPGAHFIRPDGDSDQFRKGGF